MKQINIILRDGIKEPLDITKIQKYTSKSVIGLSGVSQSEIEVDAQLQFRDEMTSEEIQKALIRTAVDKIDIDVPNWTFVASRLFMFDLYHRVGKTLKTAKGTPYGPLKTYMEYGEKNEKIIPGLKDLFFLEELDSEILSNINETIGIHERDLQFNYLGVKTLYDRYLLKNNQKEVFELPQHMFMAIAMFIAQRETNVNSLDFSSKELILSKYSEEDDISKAVRTYWAKKFYNMISTFEVMLATPTLSNARTLRHQLSSCYIGSSPDNIEGIFDAYKEQALLSKYGGGIGWDWHNIRGAASYIAGHKGAAGGLIPFLKIDNDIAIAVDQLGCVDRDSYVKILDYVETDKYKHSFIKRYDLIDLNDKDVLNIVAAHASSFAFEYGKFSKNFISSFIYDYIMNDKGHIFLEKLYGLSHDQYKKILNKYKKINKGIPIGFETMKRYEKYLISKEGIVISKAALRPIKTIIDKKGYVRLTIGKTSEKLHSLLVEQYVGSPKGFTIDHIDGNKKNNSLDNLQIMSNEENISKGWESFSEKRKEKIRIKKFLSYGYNPNGKRSDYNVDIKHIEVKTVKITDVKIGDLILSYNTSTNSNEFKEILGVHSIDVKEKDQIKIVFEDGNHITTSNWHPILKKENGSFIFARSDSLEEGDICLNHEGTEVKVALIDNNPKVDENYIDLTVKGNNNYFCSTNKEEGSFYLIHNTRKGAIATYIEPWHLDILDFLDLKKNSGEERRRAHDIFPALWIPDFFMERVIQDGLWTFFSPDDVSDLHSLYDGDFKKAYIAYEQDPSIRKEQYSAKDLWKKILTSYFETGTPFLTFKDAANRANPNPHAGVIYSSNLCTEIFQNTSPNHYRTKIKFEDGSIEIYEEEDLVQLDSGITKKAKHITALDKLHGKQIYIVDKDVVEGRTAVCNLGSVNLAKIHTKEDMARIIPIAVRALDNVIDLNFYPNEKTKATNLKSRAIGLGVMGEAQMLAEAGITYGTQEHFEKVDEIMETFSYFTIQSSALLSQEKGSYPEFEGSNWNKGIMPFDHSSEEVISLTNREESLDWFALRELVKQGMRNGYTMAIAPTSSISILVGTSQAIEPIYKRKWFEENLSGLIPVTAPNLCPDTWAHYVPAYDLDQTLLIKAGAIRQKWIDQGQSLNIFMSLDKASGKVLNDIYMLAWKLGLKSTYYLRSESPKAKEEQGVDRSTECEGCQ